MKIDLRDMICFLNHLDALGRLTEMETNYFKLARYKELLRLEKKASSLNTRYSNGVIKQEIFLKGIEVIEKEVRKLFFDDINKYVFVSTEPRGYALKINIKDSRKINCMARGLYTDLGGDGILAPIF